MRLLMRVVVFALVPLLACNTGATTWVALDSGKVIASTRFLEDHPLDKQAPPLRAALIQWEANSKDVIDVVCPGVFAPLPDASIKYNSELLAQFIFGSGMHQLVVPEDKGKLMPAQLAGVTSMLKAYRAFLAAHADARIPRFDTLSRAEAGGTLAATLEPLVIANCLPKPVGKSRFPWTFGMTKEQVTAVEGYGPYRNFRNGDLETYNGIFDGHFRNFQFFFRDNRLHRIGISTSEGTDIVAATREWGALYESMQRTFGRVETPANKMPARSDAESLKTFEASARSQIEQGGKAQMASLQQPSDAFVFASFYRAGVQGTMFYYICIFFDPPHEPVRVDDGHR